MKYVVLPLGSTGDLYPLLGIAGALHRGGREVEVLGQAPYRSAVEAEGLRFRSVLDEARNRKTLEHPKLWHPVDGFGVLWRHLAVPAATPTCDALLSLAEHEPLHVLASPLAVGARLAVELRPERIRLTTAYTSPSNLRSVQDPMWLGPWQVPQWLPHTARHWGWKALDRWKLEPMARPRVEAWCAERGLPAPAGSIFGDWIHSPQGGLALYPEPFAPIETHWQGRGVRAGGFPLYRPATRGPLPEAVQAFIEAPGPFALHYAGSAARRDDETAAAVLSALLQQGLRVLQIQPFLHPELDGTASQDPQELRLLRSGQLPWHLILPRAALLVHHGGIGTLAEAWAAGTPQLILPTAFDQFDNAQRVEQLGLGTWLRVDAKLGQRLGQAIKQWAGRRTATSIRPEPAAERLAHWLEALN